MSSWLMLRCLRMGFFAVAVPDDPVADVDGDGRFESAAESVLSILRNESAPPDGDADVNELDVGVQFGPRCSGPYNQVTSESLSLSNIRISIQRG